MTSLLRAPLPPSALGGLSTAPLRQELRDERMCLARLDSQGRQCERHCQCRVIPDRPGRDGTRVGRMGVVDPDRAVNQPPELQIAGSRFELDEESIARGPSTSSYGVEG